MARLGYGAGTATYLQARYAGADLAAPGRRARAIPARSRCWVSAGTSD